MAGAIIVALAVSCDDPIIVDDRPNDWARMLFEVEPDAGYYLSTIGYPSPSPDGRYLAFSYTTDPYGEGIWRCHIALYDLISGEISILLESAGFPIGGPSYSPDGTRIMYSSGYDVYIYTLADESILRVTPGDSWYGPVDWGSGGESIVVQEVAVPGVGTRVYEIDVDTLEMTHLFDVGGGDFMNGQFSPNHDRFLVTCRDSLDFSDYYEIRLYDTSTWEYEVLFDCIDYGYIGNGGWSKDGTEVLLVHKAAPQEEFLRVYNVETGGIKYATWTPRDDQHPDGENTAGWTANVQSPVWSVSEDVIFYECGFKNRIWVIDSP